MSNLFGDIEIIEHGESKILKKDEIQEYFKDKIISENGVIYDTNKTGIIADVSYNWFIKRKQSQAKAKELYAKAQSITDEKEKEKIIQDAGRYYNEQLALKILINSIYGLLGTRFSRWYDIDNAEGVTTGGRYVIQKSKKIINDFFLKKIFLKHPDFCKIIDDTGLSWNKNKPISNVDFILAIDTDSLFIALGKFADIIELDIHSLPEVEQVEIVNNWAKYIQDYLNVEINKAWEMNMNSYSFKHNHKIIFEQEIVGTTGIFLAKKRYGIKIKKNKKGICDETEIKGLDVVRSDSPEFIRKELSQFIDMILEKKTEKEIMNFVDVIKVKYETLEPFEKAFPVGCNEINKWLLPNFKWLKGTPVQVKSSINHNNFIQMYNVKVDPIKEKSKIKYIYLKDNPYGFDTFGFIEWKEEFDILLPYFDKNKMLEKLVDDKIKPFLTLLNFRLNNLGGSLDDIDLFD